ncbi:hypothetical protein D3C81_1560240 [compost metagenome]
MLHTLTDPRLAGARAILDLQGHWRGLLDHLQQRLVSLLEAGAQHLMALGQAVEGPLQGHQVQFA